MVRWLAACVVLAGVTTVAAAQSPPDPSGRWSGSWVSDTTGHSGPLHARVRPWGVDTYRVVYTGRFARVVPFRYATTMRVTSRGEDVLVLAGGRRLPLLGEYRSVAVATADQFVAGFTSRRETGRFVLTRR